MAQRMSGIAYGGTLLLVYIVLYGGFIALNVGWPHVMTMRVRGGVTVAVAYGIFLIFAAVLLAVTYLRRMRARA